MGAPTHLNKLPPEHEKSRYVVDSRGSTGDVRSRVMKFFKTESFTIAPGDGSLSGLDALLQLAKNPNSTPHSIPILVLHSGHQLELPQELGIIVVRKPLKRDDFVPMFERNAENLIETGMCVEVQKGDEVVVQNRGGAQLFVKQKCIELDTGGKDNKIPAKKRRAMSETSRETTTQPSKKPKPNS